MISKAAAAAFCISLILSLAAYAGGGQSTTAILSGRIVDPQHDAISGVQVTAMHQATAVQRQTTTNDEGVFVLTNLPPGEYEIKAASAGFSEKIYPAVVLQVGQSSTLNITLEVGRISESNELFHVELVNTKSSVLDGVIARREIETLPLNGRNFLELALLIPGNAPAPNFDPTKTNTVLISS